MDWFKRKNAGNGAAAPPVSVSPPPASVTGADASPAGAPSEPTAEQKLAAFELEMKETISEYVRKLESLALVIFERSEENEQLMEKLRVQEEDMKVLLDRVVSQEKELETYKENQTEYKRRLEVLTDCLEDLARENMKLAARGAPASMPDDYEEERMPTRQEVQIQKTKSEVAAESAARSVPTKAGSRTLPPSTPPPLTVVPTRQNTDSPSASRKTASPSKVERPPPEEKDETPPESPRSDVSTPEDTKEPEEKQNKEGKKKRFSASLTGGLVLPSKSKSKPDVRDTPDSVVQKSPSSSSTKSPVSPDSTSASTSSKHQRSASNGGDVGNLANDPEALMVVLKKYKSQADTLRRVRTLDPPNCPRFSVTDHYFAIFVRYFFIQFASIGLDSRTSKVGIFATICGQI